MTLPEKALFHQIHPAKLAIDITTVVASTWLMWRHEIAYALLIGLCPSIVASALMIRFMDFERQRASRLAPTSRGR